MISNIRTEKINFENTFQSEEYYISRHNKPGLEPEKSGQLVNEFTKKVEGDLFLTQLAREAFPLIKEVREELAREEKMTATDDLAIAAGVTAVAGGVQAGQSVRGKLDDVFFFDPNDESSLKPLKQGQAAFPDLDYAGPLAPLEDSRRLGSIRSMQTVLYGRGYREAVEEMRLSALEISEQMIWLENNINELVCAYRDKPDSSLAEQVFHKIQLWGGITGRNIYVRKGGFRNNFSIRKYEAMVRCLLDGIKEPSNLLMAGLEAIELSRALIVDDFRIPYLGVSFATKHFRFWSGGRLPIFDNQMAMGIFGEGANWKRYPHYVRCMINAAGQKGVEVSVLERKQFNYFQSPKALTLPPRNLRQKLTSRERSLKELMDL